MSTYLIFDPGAKKEVALAPQSQDYDTKAKEEQSKLDIGSNGILL